MVIIRRMEHSKWLARVAGEDSTNAIATNAGIYTATLAKQIKRGRLSPEVVISVARGYKSPVLDALVSCGYITAKEAELKGRIGLEEALREANDEQLLRELLRRVDEEGSLTHPTLIQPLDSDHPAMRAHEADVTEMRRPRAREEDLPDFTKLAARTVTNRPEWDAIQALNDIGEESQDPGDYED